jgi:hypothetical protein
MGIDAGNLWGCVGSQTKHATRNLIDQFEGLKVQGFASPGQQ